MTTIDHATGKQYIPRKASRLMRIAQEQKDRFKNKLLADMYLFALEQKVQHNNPVFLDFLNHVEVPPVGIEEFLDSEEYFAATRTTLWPEVRQAIIDINKYWWKGEQGVKEGTTYVQVVCTGATGTGKTQIAIVCLLYMLYLLSCLKSPQKVYGLSKYTPIIVAIFSAKPHVTKKVVYLPLRKMIADIPHFQKRMMFNKLVEAEMVFDNKNIRVVPEGADAESILGEAVIGGQVDEINFMQIIRKSKKAETAEGRAGLYDQAAEIHGEMLNRREGRFLYPGPQIGMVLATASKRYNGEYTDKLIEQKEKGKVAGMYVYNKMRFEAQPARKYSGVKFRIMLSNDSFSKSRILKDDEVVPENASVLDIPVEHKEAFDNNFHKALRDICGISDDAIMPFFRLRHRIMECVDIGQECGLQSFLLKDNVKLGDDGMPAVVHGHYCKNPSKPRYVHIDLSRNGDRCGIGMVRYDGMAYRERITGEQEYLPVGVVELACSIEPSPGHEIDFAEVRAWVKHLRSHYKYPIKAVTYDGWQSVESQQQMKKAGLNTGQQSVDRYSKYYKNFRDAIYDHRVLMYDQSVLIQELYELEYDEVKDKVDHPPNGSKDVADAVCGAYSTMITRRKSWTDHPDESERRGTGRPDPGERYAGQRR